MRAREELQHLLRDMGVDGQGVGDKEFQDVGGYKDSAGQRGGRGVGTALQMEKAGYASPL